MQHDIKKIQENLSEAEISERQKNAEVFRDLLQSAFKIRETWLNLTEEEKTSSSESALRQNIEDTNPILNKCPDCYSIFAFRREMFQRLEKAMFPAFVEKAKAKKKAESLEAQAQAAKEEQDTNTESEGKAEEQEQANNNTSDKKETPVTQGSNNSNNTDPAALLKLLQEQYRLYFSKEVLVPELMVNTEIVKKDYKSYAAWVHRRWVLNAMHPKVKIAVLKEENAKIEQLLSRDERNFHAWGYRRWVTSELKGADLYSDDQELSFATSKIGNNFSNYSAWHNRALVLWERIDQIIINNSSSSSSNDDDVMIKKVLDQISEDQNMLIQAFYCDPNDQSAFVYCKNLIGKVHEAATNKNNKIFSVANESLQQAVRDACEELKEEEQRCSWPRYMLLCLPLFEVAEKKVAWEELKKLDPMRKNYFEYEINRI